jgi:hypothetical protein
MVLLSHEARVVVILVERVLCMRERRVASERQELVGNESIPEKEEKQDETEI